MTDVPSKHVWKIKESRIVFKDFDIIAVVPTYYTLLVSRKALFPTIVNKLQNEFHFTRGS